MFPHSRSDFFTQSVVCFFMYYEKLINISMVGATMIKKLLVASLLAMAGTGTMAQSAFQGFYGQVASGFEANRYSSINSNTVGASDWYTNTSSNQSSSGAPLVLGVGYNYSLTDKYLVGLGFDYSALPQSTGNFSQLVTPSGGGQFEHYNLTYKVSNRMNLFVTPGYAPSKEGLVYLKAGYSIQKLQLTQGTDSSNLIDQGYTSSKNVNGYILGLGYKHMIANGFYGFVEGNRMAYNNTSTNGTFYSSGLPFSQTTNVNIKTYSYLAGIGYKF